MCVSTYQYRFITMSDLRLEEVRLNTFEKWPVSFLSPETMAKNGFYYLGRSDEVRCAFCKVEIMRWKEGEDPAVDHKKWAPQCPFVKGIDVCGSIVTTNNIQNTTTHDTIIGPAHPKYAHEAARVKSFHNWPRCMKQRPEQMADAGFFYTGYGDNTKCFYCDGGLKDWEPEDVPWEQHARWFDRCAYVQLVKGRDYVQKVITEACVLPGENTTVSTAAPVSEPIPETKIEKEPQVEDSKLCKICYVEECIVCFVPCGHVVACAKCALSVDKCPMCRKIVTSVLKVYFS